MELKIGVFFLYKLNIICIVDTEYEASEGDSDLEDMEYEDSSPDKPVNDFNPEENLVQNTSPQRRARADFFTSPPEPVRLDPWKMFEKTPEREVRKDKGQKEEAIANEEEIEEEEEEEVQEEVGAP